LVLFGMQNRTNGPYLAAMHRMPRTPVGRAGASVCTARGMLCWPWRRGVAWRTALAEERQRGSGRLVAGASASVAKPVRHEVLSRRKCAVRQNPRKRAADAMQGGGALGGRQLGPGGGAGARKRGCLGQERGLELDRGVSLSLWPAFLLAEAAAAPRQPDPAPDHAEVAAAFEKIDPASGLGEAAMTEDRAEGVSGDGE
jgi:hypothetical protein